MTATVGRISLGKILISASAVFAGVGPYLADWNETHIYNPTWPPHAKFHNAQTMSLGAGWPEAVWAEPPAAPVVRAADRKTRRSRGGMAQGYRAGGAKATGFPGFRPPCGWGYGLAACPQNPGSAVRRVTAQFPQGIAKVWPNPPYG